MDVEHIVFGNAFRASRKAQQGFELYKADILYGCYIINPERASDRHEGNQAAINSKVRIAGPGDKTVDKLMVGGIEDALNRHIIRLAEKPIQFACK